MMSPDVAIYLWNLFFIILFLLFVYYLIRNKDVLKKDCCLFCGHNPTKLIEAKKEVNECVEPPEVFTPLTSEIPPASPPGGVTLLSKEVPAPVTSLHQGASSLQREKSFDDDADGPIENKCWNGYSRQCFDSVRSDDERQHNMPTGAETGENDVHSETKPLEKKQLHQSISRSFSVNSSKEDTTSDEVVNPSMTPLHKALFINFFNKDFSDLSKREIDTEIRKAVQQNLLNKQDNEGRTPLHIAVKRCWPITPDKLNVIDQLLNIPELDVNAVDNNGRTALHHCVYKYNKLEIFSKLIHHPSIEVNKKDTTDLAVLHYLVLKTHKEHHAMLKTVLDNNQKFDLNIKSKEGKTALHFSVLRKLKPINIELLLLCPSVDLNIQDKFGKTPFHYACDKKDKEKLVKAFLNQKRLDVKILDNYDKTPLHYLATHSGNAKSLELLLAHDSNIDINVLDKTHKSPLHYTAKLKDPSMIWLFLNDPRIKVDGCDDHNGRDKMLGRTVLHYCVSVGCDVDVLTKIIDLAKDKQQFVHMQDDKGDTAMIIAKSKILNTGKEEYKLIELALEKYHKETYNRSISLDDVKADDLLNDTDGYELLKQIFEHNRETILTNIIEGRTNFLHFLMAKKMVDSRMESLKLLLDKNVIDVYEQDEMLKTPLHHAANNCFEYVDTILKKLKDRGETEYENILNVKDKHEQTALHTAVRHCKGTKKMITSFVEYGGLDINICDKHKKTALHYACDTQRPNSAEVISYMLENGADTAYIDSKGMTVLHHCCKAGQSNEVVEMVMNKMPPSLYTHVDKNGKTAFLHARDQGHQALVSLLLTKEIVPRDGLKVSDLKPSHYKKLHDLKKKIGIDYCWEKFCRHLNKTGLVVITNQDVESIRNPRNLDSAQVLFENLKVKCPTTNISELKSAAELYERGDLLEILKDVDDTTCIPSISGDLKIKICFCLAIDVEGVHGWKDFAEYFKFKTEEIDLIDSRPIEQSCPLEQIFRLIKVRQPCLTLYELADAAGHPDLQYHSVKKVLENIILSEESKLRVEMKQQRSMSICINREE